MEKPSNYLGNQKHVYHKKNLIWNPSHIKTKEDEIKHENST